MNRSSRACFFTLLSAGGVLLSAGEFATAQEADPRLEKVLADWQKRRERIQRVRYVVRGEHVYVKGSGTDDVGRPQPEWPTRDVAGEMRWMLLFDFATGRHRREISLQLYDHKSDSFYPHLSYGVFDGTVSTSIMPPKENTSAVRPLPANDPDMVIARGNLRYSAFESEYLPLLFGHGSVRCRANDALVPGKLLKQPEPGTLHVHGTGVHDGRPCVVIRTPVRHLATTSYNEYWADTARDSAIIRYIEFSGDKPFNSIDVSYQRTAHGWLPERWTFTHYSRGKTYFLERMRVAELQVDPPISDADFQIEPWPGVRIEDRTYEENPGPTGQIKSTSKRFVVADDGQWVEVVNGVAQSPPSHRRYWLTGSVAVMAVLAGGIWLLWRWRRHSRGRRLGGNTLN
jgi:hypothetical protein